MRVCVFVFVKFYGVALVCVKICDVFLSFQARTLLRQPLS